MVSFSIIFRTEVCRTCSDVSPKPPPVLSVSDIKRLQSQYWSQMFTRLQGFTTFYPSQILLQTCSCSKPRLICRKGSLKHISSQLFNLSRLFSCQATHVTPFSWLKMIEAEGSQTFRWSLTKPAKKAPSSREEIVIRSNNLKPIYESKCSSESAGLAGVSSEMGLDDGLLVCTLLLLI